MRRHGRFIVAATTAAAAAATPRRWHATAHEASCADLSTNTASDGPPLHLIPHPHVRAHLPRRAASSQALASTTLRRGAACAVAAAAVASPRVTQTPVRCCASSPPTPSSPASQMTRASARQGDGDAAYDEERHIESAEAALREVFGPLAKLVLHRITQRRHIVSAAADGEEDGEDGDAAALLAATDADAAAGAEAPSGAKTRLRPAPPQGHYYRASATFRLLGFPVELASVKGQRAKETIEACLYQALSSDVSFIHTGRGGPRHAAAHHRGGRGFGRHRGADGPANTSGFSARGMGHNGGGRLTPHQVEFKAIMNDLRKLCAHFSRTVKFSVKPPPQQQHQQRLRDTEDAAASAPAEVPAAGTSSDDAAVVAAPRAWRCRCYVKEEWSTSPQARLAHESMGSSPNDALVRCVTQLRQQYGDEINSAVVMQEGVHEVAALVQGQHKTVRATWHEEAVSPAAGSPETHRADDDGSLLHVGDASSGLRQPSTFSAQLQLIDQSGNTATYHARRQTSPYAGFQTAAVSAIRAEWMWDGDAHLLSQRLATPPLLWRLRWQFNMMVDHICRETGRQASDVAWIQIGGTGLEERGDVGGAEVGRAVEAVLLADNAAQPTALHNQPVVNLPDLLTGSVNAEGNTVVWQAAGAGRYRIELDTYVQAMYYLLDQYGDSLASLPCMASGLGEGLLFPTAPVLDLQVMRHDSFPILQQHRGKWTCYAVLGTLTQQLLGCAYNTHYGLDPVRKEWVCTLTVNNGRESNFPFAQGRSKQKGESWRHACLSAFRDNFPRQYAAVLDKYPDVDLSQDTGARSSRFRDLPREKRIAHVTSFAAMVFTFVEEDLGWKQARVRLRNLSVDIGLPQWVAELEVQVEGEDGRRVVAVSPAFTQAKTARRSIVYRIAVQYLPKELEWYRKLNRSDGDDPEQELHQHRTKLYNPRAGVDTSMLGHVISLMERGNATMAPIKITLEGRVRLPPPSEQHSAAATEVDNDGDTDSVSDEVDCGLADGDASLALCQQPEILLRPFNLVYRAQVLGDGGNVLIADYDSDLATTPADAAAVPVLVTALKSASVHIAGADAETLWTEYETYPTTGLCTHRDLAVSLFTTFFGANAKADEAASTPSVSAVDERSTAAGAVEWIGSTADPNAVVSAVTVSVGPYWFTTVVLPRFGMLPIARAIASTKRRSIKDALSLAARRSFPRLMHYCAKHEGPCTALATEMLTLSVVENLPEAAVRDVKALLRKARASRPPPPIRLLLSSIRREHPLRDHRLRMQHSYDTAHGHQYRLYFQRGRISRPGSSQLVGYGASPTSPTEALDRASLVALENLFESELLAAERAQPGYSTPEFWSTQKP